MLAPQAHPLRHVAIIMDGNNRWARQRGLAGIAGHKAGVERVRDILTACGEHGIETLTLFAFSSENWRRPAVEVRGLMSLFASYLKKEAKGMKDQGIRLKVIGEREKFSKRLRNLVDEAEQQTAGGKRTLVLAVGYGGQWDITQAARKLACQVRDGDLTPEEITGDLLEQHLSLSGIPMPDLCIRTAGEQRLSNFMLWQLAYAEMYFADCYWPDFDEGALALAIRDYYRRQRRFGLREPVLDGEKASA